MNRFALLDSDNEDEQKVAKVTTDKKKTATTSAAAPAAKPATAPAAKSNDAPKKTNDSKPKSDRPKSAKPAGEKKTDKPRTPKPAAAAGGGESGEAEAVVAKEKGTHRDRKSHGHAPKGNFEKKRDEQNPHIKPNNRIRGVAHGIERRRPHKNSERVEADQLALEGEKHAENVVEAQPETEEQPETVAEEQVVEPAEPEKVIVSFDEFQRQREEARAASAVLASKAARVVDELSGLKLKETDESGVYTGVSKQSKQGNSSSQRSKSKTVLSDIGFTAAPAVEAAAPAPRENKSRGPRDGRSNNSRPARAPKTKVDLLDVNAFPSL